MNMQSTLYVYCTFTIILFCGYGIISAQNPDWHTVPKDSLDENNAAMIQMLLTTTDESIMLDVIKKPSTDENTLKLKMFAYKQLGKYGSKESGPILVSRFDLHHEGFYARYAAEMIPGLEVDEILCSSLKDLKVPAAIAGTLTTLGVRAQLASVNTARDYLKHDDAEVRKAAAYAYARCAGNDEAAIEYFAQKSIDREQVDSGFLLAEELLAKGEKEKAIKLYEVLTTADVAGYQKDSAVYRGLLAYGNEGVKMLVDLINSDAAKLFLVSLKAGRELPSGAVVTQTMIEQLGKQDDSIRKARLVRAIGDRKDRESKELSLPVLSGLASSGDEKVRVAAIDSLRNIGDTSVWAVLIEAANQSSMPAVVAAAKNTLSNLPGQEIDQAIIQLLDFGDATAKLTAIELVQERRITSAFPLLKKNMQDSDERIGKAALDAMAQVASVDDLPMLFDIFFETKNAKDVEAIQHVLLSVCTRMPQEAAASEAIKAFDSASGPAAMRVKLFLFDLLKQIGGPHAIGIVEQHACGSNEELKDKATAVIGQWSKPEDVLLIADVCLKLARESNDNKYKLRGLRSAIRLARQFEMPENKRLEICEQAFGLAQRDEDKILVLDVYWRKPSLKMLAAAMKHIDNKALREKVCATAVTIGERLEGKSPEIADAMKQVLEKSNDRILKDKAQIVLNRQ